MQFGVSAPIRPNSAETEFGVFFSPDSGGNWKELATGLPTIAVRDIAIQRRENDLVLGTFGRGFYVMDDYSVLRSIENTQTARKVDRQAAAVGSRTLNRPICGLASKFFMKRVLWICADFQICLDLCKLCLE